MQIQKFHPSSETQLKDLHDLWLPSCISYDVVGFFLSWKKNSEFFLNMKKTPHFTCIENEHLVLIHNHFIEKSTISEELIVCCHGKMQLGHFFGTLRIAV